jgi:hypothetical protein
MARSLRELSKCCGKCGVVWDETLSNKEPKRALCKDCFKIEYKKRKEAMVEKLKVNGNVTQVTKKKPYTFKNRKGFWRETAAKLKGMDSRKEWLPFIQQRMQEILNDTQLMDYINDTQIANYDKD